MLVLLTRQEIERRALWGKQRAQETRGLLSRLMLRFGF